MNTSNASNKITATPSNDEEISVKVNGKDHENGTAFTWNAGANTVTIDASNSTGKRVYTVIVNKA